MASIRRGQGDDTLASRAGRLEGLRSLDPFRAMQDLFGLDLLRDLEQMVPAGRGKLFSPSFDVKETPSAYVFCADLPGVKEDDLDISLTGNRITVSGHREEEERQEGESYFALERASGSFSRTFTLPEGVLADAAKADFKNGVLTVTIPKRPEAQAKKIAIGAADKKQVKA